LVTDRMLGMFTRKPKTVVEASAEPEDGDAPESKGGKA
jgi:hypothetical protein